MSLTLANKLSKTLTRQENNQIKNSQRNFLKTERQAINSYYEQNSQLFYQLIYQKIVKDIDNIIKDRQINVIAGYWPIATEFNIKPVLEYFYSKGYDIGLPVIVGVGKPLIFREWNPDIQLVKNGFCFEPSKNQSRVTPDLLLVPFLGFNSQKYRLGYGQGFYDRTIQQMKENSSILTIGVGFQAQLYQNIQYNPDEDQKLDYIVTEKEIFS